MRDPVGRRLLLALLATFTCLPVTAHAGPAFGVMGGVVGARLHGDYGDAFGDEYRAGGAFGARARFGLRPGLSLQPELWWIMKGSAAEIGSSGPGIEPYRVRAVHSIPYVEMPVLLRLELPAGGAVAPYFAGGPALAVRLPNHLDFEPDRFPLVYAASPRVRLARIFEGVGTFDHPDLAGWDWGLVGGAGMTIGRGDVRLDVEARYERGFVNLLPDDDLFGRATNGSFSGIVGIEVR